MEVHLSPDLQDKLSRLATQQGCAADALVEEAVARLVKYDEWFLTAVDRGLAAAERDDMLEHDEIRKMIDARYPG
jgi:predicted transcriptional regulator